MRKKILVVDNNPLILELMTDLLEKEGHQVLAVEDGLSALGSLKTYIPDVIFVDLIMPNIGGKKLCQIIRAMPDLKDAYLVILSAIAAEEEPDIAKLGVNAYIAKGPFDEMKQHVLNALDQSHRTTEDMQEKIVGVEGIFPREITSELLAGTKSFEVIVNSMQEGIIEITSQHRMVYVNPSALSIIGRPEEKLLGLRFFEIFDGSDRTRTEKLLEKFSAEPQIITEESPLTLNSRLISLNIIPVNGDEQKAIIILNDITDRKRAEEEQEKLEAQLQQAQKMEAMGTLAGGIAHDFNNLLMGILGNASVMLATMESANPDYEKLKTIEKLVRSGSNLTSQLLGYARKGRYVVKPINLNQLVEETTETFGRTRKEIIIHQDLAEDLLAVEAEEGQIEQVLFNLYVNAADAMPSGGNLILRTSNGTHEEMKGKLYQPKTGNYVVLEVTDTGKGMDKETVNRIFDPFFTTKEMGRGTGLGLASAYGIIKGHGGYIEADSEEGKGTTFTVYLPATEKRVEKKVTTTEQIVRGSETILLVDDEELIRDVGGLMLPEIGYKVLLARSGEDAIKIYKEKGEEIDLVILDIVMPGLGGGETYDKLKEVDPEIKVLLSSGYSIDGTAQEILDRGCKGFIQKPFDMAELSKAISGALKK